MSEDRDPVTGEPETVQPARFTRETLIGCVGLGLVLLTLPLLWLSASVGAAWLSHTLPLLALLSLAAGGALALGVPAGRAARSRDPQRPLTRAGVAPSIERPATSANRAMWGLSAALIAIAIAGYGAELVRPGAVPGLTLMLAAGALLVIEGALVSLGRAPVPALRWLRLTMYGGAGRQSLKLLVAGAIALIVALFLAQLDGYIWGVLGLATLIAALALLTPLVRRTPPPRFPAPSRNQGHDPQS